MKIAGHDIAVCSWSLQPADIADLVRKVRDVGLRDIQLSLLNLTQLDDKRKHFELGHLRASGMKLTSGMMSFPGEDYSTITDICRTGGFVPDEQWPLRRRLARETARLAEELGIRLVSTHVGFVPSSQDPDYPKIRDRVRDVAADFAGFGVDLLMETGQERAAELLEFLDDLETPSVGINFDPANMILYGAGDPINAIRTLAGHIRHVHVKDAIASGSPGVAWGEEVAFGTGHVNPRLFLDALGEAGYAGPLTIEREAGTDRIGDVRAAVVAIERASIR